MRMKMILKHTAVLVTCLFLTLSALSALSALLPGQVYVAEQGGGTFGGGTFTSVSELEEARIGVQTGTSFDKIIEEKLPDAHKEYYNNKADLLAALTGRKIDAFIVDEPVARLLLREHDGITCLPEYMNNYFFAPVFAKNDKGQALRSQFNDFLRQLPEQSLDMLAEKWFGEDEKAKDMPDIRDLPAKKGTLRMATAAGYAPFEYVRDGEIVGYDIELAAMFCEACGYGLEIVDMTFDGILPAVQTHKCDFASSGITITPERMESVLFSDPTFSGGAVMVVRKEEASAGVFGKSGKRSFWGGISSSFEKTFIRERRWRLFAVGIGTTFLITLLSILFGTVLGFAVFMLCRNGNPVANAITGFCVWLVQGMPVVVLLMILFYVVFGKTPVSGVAVAVTGFTLTFGAAVFDLMKMGVGTVDRGQYEAAYALGHSDHAAFFRIILPQAIPHILPAYQGEIVGLIKATAVVGYIAVQDLTRMGDIVRSRTYEAFFPLIAITAIYFIMEGLMNILVGRLRLLTDPKKRTKARILKGVRTDDKN